MNYMKIIILIAGSALTFIISNSTRGKWLAVQWSGDEESPYDTITTTSESNDPSSLSSGVDGTSALDVKIAWLMSFPNSGTSYTLKTVRRATRTATATNYGQEALEAVGDAVPVFKDQPVGPFWVDSIGFNNSVETLSQNFVLTKTHCGIRCMDCPPERYVETTYSFRYHCLYSSVVKRLNGRKHTIYGAYKPARVGKAVHLIRNPFDNVVSRFHMQRKVDHIEDKYTDDREGFRKFCADLDAKYTQEENNAYVFNKVLLSVTQGLPCRAEFFRYIEWHNMADILVKDLGLDYYVLYYDSYIENFNQTVTDLVDFLEMKVVADPAPFVEGKVYLDYFTNEERIIVKAVVQYMASTATWGLLSRYFR